MDIPLVAPFLSIKWWNEVTFELSARHEAEFDRSVLGAATITLYDVVDPQMSPDPSVFPYDGKVTISPVTTQSDGKTVYEQIAVISGAEAQPLTDVPGPQVTTGPYTTTVGTFAEDSTEIDWRISFPPSEPSRMPEVYTDRCFFQGTTAALCEQHNIIEESWDTKQSTSVYTWTGVPTPISTIVLSQASGANPGVHCSSSWGIGISIGLTTAVKPNVHIRMFLLNMRHVYIKLRDYKKAQYRRCRCRLKLFRDHMALSVNIPEFLNGREHCLSLLGTASGESVTVYNIVNFNGPQAAESTHLPQYSAGMSRLLLPISTESDGKTVYEEIVVVTTENLIEASTTVVATGMAFPTIRSIAGPHFCPRLEYSGINSMAPPNPSGVPDLYTETCVLQGTTAGSCVEPLLLGDEPHPAWSTAGFTTVTAALAPIFTLGVQLPASASASTSTSSSNSNTNGSGALTRTWGVGAIIIVSTAVMISKLAFGM
ncbi:hypothetical protein NP233_g3469 [Leucocoprinus birnbaumii]|uniref:Uncharacterized protein n=1 Tax=Leucocoprinus birnbaumii TaxID=56174 RepID=A0AAD5YYA9_9AGAR|nr:hypothetical protein NP233_g3469 [Leucocoprinus birnbaumii]